MQNPGSGLKSYSETKRNHYTFHFQQTKPRHGRFAGSHLLQCMLYRMIFLVLAISYTAVLLPVEDACFVGTAAFMTQQG